MGFAILRHQLVEKFPLTAHRFQSQTEIDISCTFRPHHRHHLIGGESVCTCAGTCSFRLFPVKNDKSRISDGVMKRTCLVVCLRGYLSSTANTTM